MSYRFPIFSLLDSLSPVSLGSAGVGVTWLEFWSVGMTFVPFPVFTFWAFYTTRISTSCSSFLFIFVYLVLKVNVFMELQLNTRKGIELKRDSI